SSTYITESAKNDATSDSALTTGLRCRITTSAKSTAIAAKKKKTAYVIISPSRPVPGAQCPVPSRSGLPLGTGHGALGTLSRSYPPLGDEPGDKDDVHHRER